MKKVLILLALFSFSFTAFSQETKKPAKKNRRETKRDKINAMIKAEEEGVIAYRKHYAFGIKLTSNGYGVSFEKGYSKSVKKTTLFQLEIAEHRHQKETKQTSNIPGTSPFIYGKINYFYPIKLGVQKQFLFGNKSNKNGVSVTGNIGGGISLGLLRPYEVQVKKNNELVYIRYESADSSLFKNGTIYRGPSLGTGWNHLKLTPGLYLKPGLRFDYGRYNDLVTAIEVGVAAEFYSKKITQMFDNKGKQFFFSAYFTVLFGKRK
jgi:hypothetical protein